MIFPRLVSAVPKSLRFRLGLVILLSLGTALAQGVSIGLLLPVLQFVEEDAVPQDGIWKGLHWIYQTMGVTIDLVSLLLGVLVVIILAQILIYLQRSQAIKLREKFTVHLRRTAFSSFMSADMAYLQGTNRGHMVNTLTLEAIQASEAIFGLVEFTARCMLVIVYIGVLVLISWQMFLGGLGIVIVASLLAQYQIRRATGLGRMLAEMRSGFQSFVVERLEGIKLVKLAAWEEQEKDKFQEVTSRLSAVTHRVAINRSQIRLVMEPAIVGGGLLVLYLGVEILDISLSQLAIFMFVLVRLAPEAMNMNQLWQGMAVGLSSMESVMRGLRESKKSTTVISGSTPFRTVEQEIAFADVSCSYNPENPVLRGITLNVLKGELTAIIGPSGVGKSTLLDLLTRLADPTEGHIYLDGVDIKEFDINSLRRRVGMVTQDVMLFSDTVMGNLRYGHPNATDAEVQEAARKANAHDFIQALAEGYSTHLGYRGLTLSGGERQRLALARALVGEPSILILDEVTNNLDADSRHLVHQTIQEAAKERIVIVSTHDLALIELADKVIVLEEGRVVEEGAPEELMKGGGLYRRYFSYLNA